MSLSSQAEREIDRLEALLGETDDPAEQKALRAEIREIERELADQERWLDEGFDKGYL